MGVFVSVGLEGPLKLRRVESMGNDGSDSL